MKSKNTIFSSKQINETYANPNEWADVCLSVSMQVWKGGVGRKRRDVLEMHTDVPFGGTFVTSLIKKLPNGRQQAITWWQNICFLNRRPQKQSPASLQKGSLAERP